MLKRFSRRHLIIRLAQVATAASVASYMPKAVGLIGARMSRRRNVLPGLYAWGNNKNDRLGINANDNVSSPIMHSTTQWSKVALDDNTVYYIAPNKTLWSSGIDSNNAGLPGNGTVGSNNILPVQIGADSWKEVATNDSTTLAIKDDGTLWSWGANSYGLLGKTNLGDYVTSTPVFVASSTNWLSVGSHYHTAMINAAGELYVTGEGALGKLGLGNTANVSSLTRVGSTTWLKVSCGNRHTMAIRSDGTLWGWGTRTDGALGDGGTSGSVSTPKQIGSVTTWTDVACGYDLTMALRADGTLWFTGYNGDGTAGLGHKNNQSSFVQSATGVSKISVKFETVLGIVTDGTLWAIGDSTDYLTGSGSTADIVWPSQVGTANTWTSVSIGHTHTVATRSNGTAWVWGNNSDGQLGRGNTTTISTPVQMGTWTDWSAISAGNCCTAGIRNGTLWVWGYIGYWNNVTSVSTPIQVGADTDWAPMVRVSSNDTFYLQKTNGDLYALGYNVTGMFGLDIVSRVSTPIQIGTDTDWSKVQISDHTALALKSTGTMWQWGWLQYQYSDIGSIYYDVSLERRRSPTQVGALSTWSKISAGRSVHAAIKTDSTLWMWGAGSSLLGNGNATTHVSTPVRLGATSTWNDIALGLGTAAAIRSDGTLWTWGYGDVGQTGIGATGDKSTPVAVGSDTWSAVAAGTKHVLGIRTTGTAFGWGGGTYGQLGNGVASNNSSPVQIGSRADWRAIWAGGNGSMGSR